MSSLTLFATYVPLAVLGIESSSSSPVSLGAQAGVKDRRTMGWSVKTPLSFSSSVSVAVGAAAPPVIAATVTSGAYVGEDNGSGENVRSLCCLVVRAREVDEEEENKGSVS